MESALYGVYTLVVLYQKSNECKHRTRALSMKYSIYTLRKSPERPSECSQCLSVRTAIANSIAIVPIILHLMTSCLVILKFYMFSQQLSTIIYIYNVGNYILTALAIQANDPQIPRATRPL